MERVIGLFLISICAFISKNAQSSIYRYDNVQFEGYSSAFMMNQTRDALLSYSFIKERTGILAKRIERKVLGDYADEFMLLAPFILGRVEVRALDMRIYYNNRRSVAGMEYVYNF